MKKIIYLEHPVSKEDKEKYISEGYKIIDKQFEPKEAKAEKLKEAKA